MRSPSHPVFLFLVGLAAAAAAVPEPYDLTIFAVPYTTSDAPLVEPTPLATVLYDPSKHTAALKSYEPPRGDYAPDHLFRVGLLDSAEGRQTVTGVVTSAASFDPHVRRKFVVHLDSEGRIWRVGFRSWIEDEKLRGQGNEDGKPRKGAGKSNAAPEGSGIEIEVVPQSAGPVPALSKPIVLNPDGTPEGQEPQKSFLQKYWWVLALFLLMQIAAGGAEPK